MRPDVDVAVGIRGCGHAGDEIVKARSGRDAHRHEPGRQGVVLHHLVVPGRPQAGDRVAHHGKAPGAFGPRQARELQPGQAAGNLGRPVQPEGVVAGAAPAVAQVQVGRKPVADRRVCSLGHPCIGEVQARHDQEVPVIVRDRPLAPPLAAWCRRSLGPLVRGWCRNILRQRENGGPVERSFHRCHPSEKRRPCRRRAASPAAQSASPVKATKTGSA